ncbi:hypothetical protein DSE82_05005 [Campylobacter jejuni]|nr:hypothetical protein [Campylobacter jejuni]EAL5624777.1 hypothetical protein [Campylobacter jejuni]EAL5879120.1 hypothetical protein [Campylobacter jejuni]
MDNMQNGHYLFKSSFSKYFEHVRAVRDTIVEVDENGNVVDD